MDGANGKGACNLDRFRSKSACAIATANGPRSGTCGASSQLSQSLNVRAVEKQPPNGKPSAHDAESPPVTDDEATIEHMIGSFGWFQLCILIFSGLRECTLSYDAVIMSVVLQPETDFACRDPQWQLDNGQYLDQVNGSVSAGGLSPGQEQCYAGTWADQSGSTHLIPCADWTFANKTGATSMIAKWSLVCQNHWYVAVIESAFFAGMLVGNLVWGYTADIFGRRQAYIVSHIVALVAGSLGVFAPSIWTLVACRFFLAAGNVGNYVLCSLQMELIGTKHRSFSTMLYHVGWGLGLVFVPVVYHHLDDYHTILAVSPITLLAL